MEPSLRAEAERVCGDDISCLFDIAATKDVSIGASTLSEITTINNEISQVGMYILLWYHVDFVSQIFILFIRPFLRN
jgi:hypothetical protein